MTETTAEKPTPTALACKAVMACIDRPVYLKVLTTRARLAGWSGARKAGLRDVGISDSVAEATLHGLLDLLRQWALEVPDPDAPGTAGLDDTEGSQS